MTKLNARKAAVIGCGFVGATVAYTLMQTELFSELVLVDVNKGKAEGEALDLIHGLPFAHPMQIYAGDYNDIADAAVVVMTAGANQKPGGETRLELVKRNAAIMYSISKELIEESMIGFFGFTSLNAVVEDLRANLRRLTESNEKKAEVIKSESVGFSSVKEDAAALQDAFGAKTMSNEQLADLF